jgi:hypothetical protein
VVWAHPDHGVNAQALRVGPNLSNADYTFYATADKARRELGWQPRPLEQTFQEVLDHKLAPRKK